MLETYSRLEMNSALRSSISYSRALLRRGRVRPKLSTWMRSMFMLTIISMMCATRAWLQPTSNRVIQSGQFSICCIMETLHCLFKNGSEYFFRIFHIINQRCQNLSIPICPWTSWCYMCASVRTESAPGVYPNISY